MWSFGYFYIFFYLKHFHIFFVLLYIGLSAPPIWENFSACFIVLDNVGEVDVL